MTARLLFVTLTNDVGSDRIVQALGRHGAICAVLGPPGNFAGLSRSAARRFDMPGRFGSWAATRLFKGRLTRAARAWRPDRIVPLDELAALLLRTLASQAGTEPRLREVLVDSFGDPAGYHAACHRLALMRLAANVGVRIPASGGSDAPLPCPLVVKRDHSSGSGGVTIVYARRELPAALRKAEILRRLKRAMARAAGYAHGPDPLLLQGYVPGDLAMRTVVANRGEIVDGMSFRAVQAHPQTRASTILEPLDHPEMAAAVRRIVGTLGCSGFVSFDFMIDDGGAAHLIEMNPRPIGSTHLGAMFGHDLARAFLTGKAATQTPASMPRSVALFPKELERDPSGGGLDAEPQRAHDVPTGEPRVLAAYSAYLQALHPAAAGVVRRQLGQAEVPLPTGARGTVPRMMALG